MVPETYEIKTPADCLVKNLFPNGKVVGVPGEIRTHDPRIRNPVLYPTELRGPRGAPAGLETAPRRGGFRALSIFAD